MTPGGARFRNRGVERPCREPAENIVKIYTRTGDRGETSLFGGERVPKSAARVAAYGDIDELNAALGAAHVHLVTWRSVLEEIEQVQRVLFGIGGEVATPDGKAREKLRGVVTADDVASLEASIDTMEKELPALKTFVLPGGGAAGAALHLARTVARRAERSLVGLGPEAGIRDEIVRYLNRLSDWLFVLARYVNHRERRPELPW